MFTLCYTHPISQSSQNATPEYLNSLVERAVDFLTAEHFYETHDKVKSALQAAKSLAADLTTHKTFSALVTALDMFFLTLPKHGYAKMHMTTLHVLPRLYSLRRYKAHGRHLWTASASVGAMGVGAGGEQGTQNTSQYSQILRNQGFVLPLPSRIWGAEEIPSGSGVKPVRAHSHTSIRVLKGE